MTVRELIAHLQTMPPDDVVLYRYRSDFARMEPDDITEHGPDTPLAPGVAVPHHNMPGEFRMYEGQHVYGDRPLPAPAGVVIFPGN